MIVFKWKVCNHTNVRSSTYDNDYNRRMDILLAKEALDDDRVLMPGFIDMFKDWIDFVEKEND